MYILENGPLTVTYMMSSPCHIQEKRRGMSARTDPAATRTRSALDMYIEQRTCLPSADTTGANPATGYIPKELGLAQCILHGKRASSEEALERDTETSLC